MKALQSSQCDVKTNDTDAFLNDKMVTRHSKVVRDMQDQELCVDCNKTHHPRSVINFVPKDQSDDDTEIESESESESDLDDSSDSDDGYNSYGTEEEDEDEQTAKKGHDIKYTPHGITYVPSGITLGKLYSVDLKKHTCTCEGYYKSKKCHHFTMARTMTMARLSFTWM
jgi:hypothetical protein